MSSNKPGKSIMVTEKKVIVSTNEEAELFEALKTIFYEFKRAGQGFAIRTKKKWYKDVIHPGATPKMLLDQGFTKKELRKIQDQGFLKSHSMIDGNGQIMPVLYFPAWFYEQRVWYKQWMEKIARLIGIKRPKILPIEIEPSESAKQ